MKTFDEWWEENKPTDKIFGFDEIELCTIRNIALKSRIDSIQPYINAMNEFCDRVDCGEVRSKKTYLKFCKLLEREPK